MSSSRHGRFSISVSPVLDTASSHYLRRQAVSYDISWRQPDYILAYVFLARAANTHRSVETVVRIMYLGNTNTLLAARHSLQG